MKLKLLAVAAILGMAATACAETTPTGPGTGGPIDHPTGAGDLILKIENVGGFIPLEYTFVSIPNFALYGDGTLIQPGAQIEIYPGPALPAIAQRSVSEEGIQAILKAALDAELDTDGSFDLAMVADASTTVFTLNANGETHRIEVYALGIEGEDRPEGMTDEEWRVRKALSGFAEDLGMLQDLVPAGSLGEERMYEGGKAKLLVGPYAPAEDLPQDPKAWPLAQPLSGFGDPADMYGDDRRCGVVDGDDWVALRALASQANQLTPWTSDGETFSLIFRPLLPDEGGC